MLHLTRNLCLHASTLLAITDALLLRDTIQKDGTKPKNLEIHFDTTCTHCQEWIVNQFQPLWKDSGFQSAAQVHYNISFWAHTITSHKQSFDLNLVLDCASKNLAQADYFAMLFAWMENIEPWVRAADGSGVSQNTVDVPKLLTDSMPKRSGFDGVAIVQQCVDFERLPTIEWVRQHTPSFFHTVPLIVVGDSKSAAATDNFQDYMCKHIGKRAQNVCGASLMQEEEDASQNLCTRAEVQPTGEVLLQQNNRMSKSAFVAFEE
jgi:hypothetical protein